MRFFPTFHLKNTEARLRTNSDYKGLTLFYFYPKDDTPGCTHQACALRDAQQQIENLGVTIVGISPDDVASHIQFSTKYNIPFELLSDFEQRLSTELGIWKEKIIFGKARWGIERSSYLVNDGREIIWSKNGVNPNHHLQEILPVIEKLAPK